MFAEAAEIATAIGDKRHVLFALAGLGRVAYREERWEDASTHTRESLRLAQELGMVKRQGKFGPFLGCSNFPACTNTRNA